MNPPEPQPARRRGRKNRAFHDLLAGLVQALADSGAGVVGLTQHTKTLEEIFLTLTAPKEVG